MVLLLYYVNKCPIYGTLVFLPLLHLYVCGYRRRFAPASRWLRWRLSVASAYPSRLFLLPHHVARLRSHAAKNKLRLWYLTVGKVAYFVKGNTSAFGALDKACSFFAFACQGGRQFALWLLPSPLQIPQ